MKLVISNARVCDLQSPFHDQVCDILVSGEVIEQIIPITERKSLADPIGYQQIDASGLYIFPAFFDLRANFCDPGFENKETLFSGSMAACSGGFSDVALLPSTLPPRDSKIGIEYVLSQNKQLPINLFAYGCLSQMREGKELAELYDMHVAGAVGFTDGNKPIADSGVLLRALQYSQIFNGLIQVLPFDEHLSEGGKMHEGNLSTLLGLKGIPSVAEEIMVQRDLEVLKYAGGRLHFSTLSAKGSVDLVRKAKKAGLNVTADVAFANLCYTDENLSEYDANFKVIPTLRSKQDQKALWEGIQDGTLDAIVSNHEPQNKENKEVEFEYAAPGMITLQTLLPLLFKHKPAQIHLAKMVAALTQGPRQILNVNPVKIEIGAKASFTIFDPNKTWLFNKGISKSENSPSFNQPIVGCITHTYCKSHLHTF